jgi:hypothetical protein
MRSADFSLPETLRPFGFAWVRHAQLVLGRHVNLERTLTIIRTAGFSLHFHCSRLCRHQPQPPGSYRRPRACVQRRRWRVLQGRTPLAGRGTPWRARTGASAPSPSERSEAAGPGKQGCASAQPGKNLSIPGRRRQPPRAGAAVRRGAFGVSVSRRTELPPLCFLRHRGDEPEAQGGSYCDRTPAGSARI